MLRSGRIIVDYLEKMTSKQILLLFVVVAVGFSQLLVAIQCFVFLGRLDPFTMVVGFITPLIDALIIVWLILLVLHRSQIIKSLVDHSNDEIYVLDMNDGHIVYANNSAVHRLQYSLAEIEHLNLFDINKLSGSYKDWSDIISEVKRSGQIILEGFNRTKENLQYPVEVSFSTNIQVRQENIIAVVRDITQRKDFERKLKIMASTDPLTGVFNRRKFKELLTLEISRAVRYSLPFSLVLFDLDYFKKVNDTYGHDVGDIVLCEVSRIVSGGLRETDSFARFGGEEFVAALPCTHLKGAGVVADRLRQTIEAANFAPVSRVTASFGVVQLAADEKADELLKRVDIALYAAKNSGRNQVIIQ